MQITNMNTCTYSHTRPHSLSFMHTQAYTLTHIHMLTHKCTHWYSHMHVSSVSNQLGVSGDQNMESEFQSFSVQYLLVWLDQEQSRASYLLPAVAWPLAADPGDIRISPQFPLICSPQCWEKFLHGGHSLINTHPLFFFSTALLSIIHMSQNSLVMKCHQWL